MKHQRSIAILVFCLLFALTAIAQASPRAHTPDVTIGPEVANCSTLGNLFTVHVENDPSSANAIFEVRIYEAVAGLSDFVCSPAPSGWILEDRTEFDGYCNYASQRFSDNTIAPGESQDFTFTATMNTEACFSEFTISTLDNAVPVGQHVYSYPRVYIDCSLPLLDKEVTEPKILMDPSCDPNVATCDYWINYDSRLNFEASDEVTEQGPSACNLGLDYCEWKYTLDGSPVDFTQQCTATGGTVTDSWCRIENGSTLDFSLSFREDSNHFIEARCFDNAGNEVYIAEVDKVDGTPPITRKHFEGPQKIVEGVEWIDGVSTVVLESEDPDHTHFMCNIGVDHTYYKLSGPVDDSYCWSQCSDWETSEIGSEGWTEYAGPLGGIDNPIDESCHVLEFASVDRLGNAEEVQTNCFFVDKTPPLASLEVGSPSLPGSDNMDGIEGNEEFDWVTSQTPITLSCTDQEPHPSRDEMLWFKVWYDLSGDVTADYCSRFGGTMDGEWCTVPSGSTYPLNFTFNPNEDSHHKIEYKCTDAVGKESDAQTHWFKVDNTPPSIYKEMLGQYLGDCPPQSEADECFVGNNGESGVQVTTVDGGEICAVDQVTCNYQVIWYAWPGQVEGDETGGSHVVEEGTFEGDQNIIFHEDSNHDLVLDCYDGLGNRVTDTERFRVDSTPPETVKTYGEPYVSCEGEGCGGQDQFGHTYPQWITPATPITLTATDAKVGVDETNYRVQLLQDDTACNEARYCMPCEGDECGEYSAYSSSFTIGEQSCHRIEYYSTDLLGNRERTKWQCVFVDNAPPTGIKTIGEPHVTKQVGDQTIEFVTQQTPISFACRDAEPHPVNQSNMCFQVTQNGQDFTQSYCEAYQGTYNANGDGYCCLMGTVDDFHFTEDSNHTLSFYCEDGLGNLGETDTEFFAVESVPPIITKTIVGPQDGQCPPRPDSNDVCIIDGVTEIHVAVVDPEPHPVNDVVCDWRYRVVDGEPRGGDGYPGGGQQGVTPPFVIQFPEQSQHELYISCVDGLGNRVTDVETFFVDKTPPVTSKEFGSPYYSCYQDCLGAENLEACLVENQCQLDLGGHWMPQWVSGDTNVWLSAVDPEPHPAGVDYTQWRVTRVNDEACRNLELCQLADGTGDWHRDGTPFVIGEESCHLIEYQSVDDVNKWETKNKECVFVDNTAPRGEKIVGEPNVVCTADDPECVSPWNPSIIADYKITTQTPITLSCVDQDPHPVNHTTLHWRWKLDNAPWSEWTTVPEGSTVIRFGEESFHGLEFYCEDILGNQSDVDTEYFKVTGTPFEINLHWKWNLVSVPYVLDDDSPGHFVEEDTQGDVKSIWTYDAETRQWFVYRPDSPATSNLDNITPGWGYWVWANNDVNLPISGNLLEPNTLPPSRNLMSGWNLIGYYGTDWQQFGEEGEEFEDAQLCPGDAPFYGTSTYCSLNSLVNTFSGRPDWDSLWSYKNCGDHQSEWFGLNICTNNGSPTDMFAGKGYWILVNENQEYAPATTCIGDDDWTCPGP